MLPPRERFAPQNAGAIALLAATLAREEDVVVGHAPGAPPFPGPRFLPVPPPGRVAFPSATASYARAVAAVLAREAPRRIEVHNKPQLAALLARRFPQASTALFLHNDPTGMPGARTAQARARLARALDVIAVSAFVAGRWGAPCQVLPNAIDLAALPPPRAADERLPLFLFAGRVVADKGADVFVDAAAAALPGLPGWSATMIGADRFGPDSPETPFLRALRPRAEAACVRMAGYAPRAAVLAAMAEAAVTVVPSRWPEPFGLVALEAMACGSALIATREGGLPEVAGEAALYVPAGDPAALAEAMRMLAADPGRRARLAAAGRARAVTLFDARDARRSLAAMRRAAGAA